MTLPHPDDITYSEIDLPERMREALLEYYVYSPQIYEREMAFRRRLAERVKQDSIKAKK